MEYSRNAGLWRHKKAHEGVTFICEICNKVFTRNATLWRHKKAHEGATYIYSNVILVT